MRSAGDTWSVVRVGFGALAALLIGYLAVIAAWPQVRDAVPAPLNGFGQPNSALSIAVTVAVLAVLGIALNRSRDGHRRGAPVAIVAGLAGISALLGMASYWRCHDDSHPTFFTPVLWTASVVKGGSPQQSLDTGACPAELPVALNVAQLSALAAVFLSIVGVGMALFQARLDRLRVYFARRVTAVVDLDDDGQSMIAAVRRTLDPRSTLVILTDDPDRPCIGQARSQGARIVTVDFDRPATLTDVSLWRKLDALYLLAPDPSANLARLATITDHLGTRDGRIRIPLIVRIDDPWQATAWRAKQFGDPSRLWAPDAVGRYEVTARRLVEHVTSDPAITRILLCGASRLTLALCAEISQRQLERDYYDQPSLPQTLIVAEDATDYLNDHEYSRRQTGLPHDRPALTAIAAKPAVPLMMSLIDDDGADPRSVAVILVDDDAVRGFGTRLAVRYPDTAIHAFDPAADQQGAWRSAPLIGRLHSYPLTMDIPDDAAHDAWELAARLIHERYARPGGTSASAPWHELDEFYRESNRRQVNNALWMVEAIGGHSWNTWGTSAAPWPAQGMQHLSPLDQLKAMGFDESAIFAMARAEHEDWCRFYRRYGWVAGATRDNSRKVHPNLVDWSDIEADPDKLDKAVASLAATLSKLRELGYRSRPVAAAE
ncbi:hypothetical protein MCHIJ_46550 [Mycolicibacterium chitae]|uniref:RyR domain protein n=1 Tax=Mycolicibacterium chitae TaxID=1792 RepID=A0A3S4RI72_MYCCI|nr:hypothetical protein [Mycolicibacterium chitae]BBZ05218.1 hypothetical protein MCHIJ_46550 [Mycolicibacterium chitae]VEG48837.1 RyR domain protein [Mycolicibacterium chitae]